MFHILVADDDKNTRKNICVQSLNRTVIPYPTQKNGEEALTVMDREVIDLVVLDVMMPVMDGYEFTKCMREADNELPILMISAKQMPEDKKRGFRAGTDDYMTKPIDAEEMLLRIKALLRRARIAMEHKIVIGSVHSRLRFVHRDKKRRNAGASAERIPAAL